MQITLCYIRCEPLVSMISGLLVDDIYISFMAPMADDLVMPLSPAQDACLNDSPHVNTKPLIYE